MSHLSVRMEQMYKFMCGCIMTNCKYNPQINWTLEMAYIYLVYLLHQLLMDWASLKKNKDARREVYRLVTLAQQGIVMR
uniref:Uncharacterized protein n=1 Tax=Romanomermis culicivorax TaxID=13658 RepID=A0A915I1Y7_ROMCU